MYDVDVFLEQDKLLNQHHIAVSPDGRYVAYVVEKSASLVPGQSVSPFAGAELRVTGLDSLETYVPIPFDKGSSWAPSWSPNGSVLAFYSQIDGRVVVSTWHHLTCEANSYWETKVSPRPLSDLPRWIDNDSLLFPMNGESATTTASPQSPEQSKYTGKLLTSKPVNASPNTTVPSVVPKTAFTDCAILDIHTCHVRTLVTPFRVVAAYPSPNGNKIAFVSWRPGDDPSVYAWTEDIHVGNVDGTIIQTALATGLPVSGTGRHAPAWSPDGSRLAIINQNDIHLWDVGQTVKNVVNLPNLVPDLDPVFLLWSSDGHSLMVKDTSNDIYILYTDDVLPPSKVGIAGKRLLGVSKRTGKSQFMAAEAYRCVMWTLDPSTKNHGLYSVQNDFSVKCLIEENKSYRANHFIDMRGQFADVSADGRRMVFVAEAADSPPDLWLLDLETTIKRRVTSLNPVLPNIQVKEEVVQWTNRRGLTREGIILVPDGTYYDIPLLVCVYPKRSPTERGHNWDQRFISAFMNPQILLSNGFAIFEPELVVGEGDFIEEIAHEFDDAIAGLMKHNHRSISKQRIGIIGHSYGGYVVNCLLTHSQIPKAGVSASGFASLFRLWSTSYSNSDFYGCQLVETNPIGPNLQHTPWEAPGKYVTNSPFTWVHQVTAPLLLIGGDEDKLYQPEEMLLALERLGKSVECMAYSQEGHYLRSWRTENQRDVVERILKLFQTYL